jgi:hypothetical protein
MDYCTQGKIRDSILASIPALVYVSMLFETSDRIK